MFTTNDAFRVELTKLINERRKTLIENVVSGLAIQSHDQYREHVGRISALNEVLELMDEAETNMMKR
jgi:hypothetical protein